MGGGSLTDGHGPSAPLKTQSLLKVASVDCIMTFTKRGNRCHPLPLCALLLPLSCPPPHPPPRSCSLLQASGWPGAPTGTHSPLAWAFRDHEK